MNLFALRMSIFVFGIVSGPQVIAQQSERALYEWYDTTVGKANSAIQNGPVYNNLYRIRPESHNFYSSDYLTGSVTYRDNVYPGILLKYDIAQDILVARYEQNPAYGLQLSKSFVEMFSIDGKTFRNLHNFPSKPDFVSGYYEELTSGRISLYKKHHKDSREVIKNNRVYDDLTPNDSYIVLKDNTFFKADTKKQWSEIFPDQKSRIEDFYRKDRSLERSDKGKFLQNLAGFLQNNLSTENKSQ